MTVVALVGVTASGKSEAALTVARRRGDIEIVSVDSMCVYRGMNIGTSKPSVLERSEVPHHLLDLVDPDEEFTVTQFQEAARTALREIAARGRHALLVGGTGLYLRSVVDDLQFPGRYPDVKEALEAELVEGRAQVPELYGRLVVLDPVGAGRMEPTNRRRVVRALEVTLGSGRPFSTFGPGLEAYPPTPVVMVGITVPAEEGDRRIAERFARWIDAGLLGEVQALRTQVAANAPTIANANSQLAQMNNEISELQRLQAMSNGAQGAMQVGQTTNSLIATLVSQMQKQRALTINAIQEDERNKAAAYAAMYGPSQLKQ